MLEVHPAAAEDGPAALPHQSILLPDHPGGEQVKWSRGEYELLLYSGKLGETRATVVGATLGRIFGVHRSGKRKTYYAVTHIPTGCAVSPSGGFGRQSTAKAYAERLLPLTDWQSVTQQNVRERIDRGILDEIFNGLLSEEAAA